MFLNNPSEGGQAFTTTTNEKTFATSTVAHVDEVDENQVAPSLGSLITPTANLPDWFLRPQYITSIATSAIGIGTVFYPWELYLQATLPADKLKNYVFMRGTLCLRFNMNCSPFVMGRVLVAYDPMGYFSNVNRTNVFSIGAISHVSMDPGISSDKIMRIPYHNSVEYINLQNLAATNAAKFGKIIPYVLDDFINVNTSLDPGCTIRVFAWMEDVELVVPSLTPQSEFKTSGIISKPASAVAKFSSWFTDVPIIGTFAKATEIGAGAISSIASLFGFTRPVQIIGATATRDTGHANLMITSGIDFSAKLTFDPKSETTIGNKRIGGEGRDEMNIHYVASKPSLYTAPVSWTDAQVAGTILSTHYVNPGLSNGVYTAITYHTNLSFASMFFNLWRGSITYTFSLIKTNFNKGKLAIIWSIGSTTPTLANFNSAYNVVWDISESAEISVTIPYLQAQRYLPVNNSAVGTALSSGQCNGVVYVMIVERLSGVDDGGVNTLCKIVPYIKGGPDIEFSQPTAYKVAAASLNATGSITSEQASIVPSCIYNVAATGTFNPNHIITPQAEITLGPLNENPLSALEVIGEKVVSFRNFVKRYQFIGVFNSDNNDVNNSMFYPNFPLMGNCYTGIAGSLYTPRKTTPMALLQMAYASWRGSTRFKVRCTAPTMISANATAYYDVSTPYGFIAGCADVAMARALTSGAEFSNGANLQFLEVECPAPRVNLYTPPYTVYTGVTGGLWIGNTYDKYVNAITYTCPASNSVYQCAGDDYTLDLYVGPPPLYMNWATTDVDPVLAVV